jgi:hypothetical protein
MKRTIWVPILIGLIFAAFLILVTETQFVIPLGNKAFIGVGEIFNTISAALGGPFAIITIIVTAISHFILHAELFTDVQFTYIVVIDAMIHIFALLLVSICYYRILYLRVKKASFFFVGWFVMIGVYYYLILLPLQVALLKHADPGLGATYLSFAKIFFPEFLGTALITTLFWFASPKYFRRPQWVEVGKGNQIKDK